MTYIFVFLTSSLAAHSMQKTGNKKKKFFWAVICVLIPAIFLGGLRSDMLGTDNYVYYKTFFERYCNANSLSDVPSLSRVEIRYYEPLFSLLMFIVSRFTANYHWFCFITVLIEMVLVLVGFSYFERNVSLGFSILAFYLMFFCPFINFVRQSLAIAVCIFSLRYCFEKDLKKFVLCIAAAMCFHVTAIIFFLAYFITFYNGTKDQNKKVFWVLSGILILYFTSPYIGKVVMNAGILNAHYASYLPSSIPFKLSQLLYRLPLVMLTAILLKRLTKEDNKWYSIFLFLIVDIVISQVAGARPSGVRASYYYGILATICYSGICRLFFRESRMIAYGLATFYLTLYWIYWVVFNNYAMHYPVFPYMSDIAKWLP